VDSLGIARGRRVGKRGHRDREQRNQRSAEDGQLDLHDSTFRASVLGASLITPRVVGRLLSRGRARWNRQPPFGEHARQLRLYLFKRSGKVCVAEAKAIPQEPEGRGTAGVVDTFGGDVEATLYQP
jgi:hypothetical protein